MAYSPASSAASRTTTRMRLNGLTIRLERPRARVTKRFITIDLPTLASFTTSASTSRLWLFSALAMADASTLRTSTAMAFRSEEHTSELHSLMRISYAVFCLKKKRQTRPADTNHTGSQNQRRKQNRDNTTRHHNNARGRC